MSEYTESTLEPIYDSHTKVMILGSFPGKESLRKGEYYGHSRNVFWRIMEECLKEPLAEQSYPWRLKRLLAHGLGLWDVYAGCVRTGSRDASITSGKRNDLSLLCTIPSLELVCFNGKKAGTHAGDVSHRTAILPSTSPANRRMTYAQKRRIWYGNLYPYLLS